MTKVTANSVESMNDTQQRLQSYIDEHIPSIRAAGATLSSYNSDILVLSAPLSKNHNDHGNAFGGSLYNLALMSGWAALFLECSKKIDKPNIVTRDAQIRYRQPVNDEHIQISCRLPSERQWEGFFAHYDKTGKTSISLSSTITSGGETAVRFEGVFVLVE